MVKNLTRTNFRVMSKIGILPRQLYAAECQVLGRFCRRVLPWPYLRVQHKSSQARTDQASILSIHVEGFGEDPKL